ncbi:MAG TPA: glycosyltransferase family 4 protein [Candidatus Limnocylindria bacterium]|nr:glycosyltransferase family 4 protein [Candidatus Limnocylindria bacterium]
MSRKKQRVLLVHYTAPSILGGVERVMAVHARALREAGDDVAIVAGRGSARPVRLIRIAELDSRHPAVLRDFAALAQGEIAPAHERLVHTIERKLRLHVARADRVVVHNAFTLHKNAALTEALANLASELPGRFVAWTHDLAWTDAQYAGQLHEGRPWSLFRTALTGVRYVAVSEKARDELVALTGIPKSKVAVVPNGVDPAGLLGLSKPGIALAERLELFDADPLLLLPVRMTRRKRIDVAIDAQVRLRRTFPNAALVVTGGPGAHNPANATYARELATRAGAGVHLLHDKKVRVSDRVLSDLYALADALVLPSANEGFGIPALEAGWHRLPIVCSDIPALRAVAGDDATYVPADADGATLARAIAQRLGSDPIARLHRRSREHAWPRVLAEHVLPAIHG